MQWAAYVAVVVDQEQGIAFRIDSALAPAAALVAVVEALIVMMTLEQTYSIDHHAP